MAQNDGKEVKLADGVTVYVNDYSLSKNTQSFGKKTGDFNPGNSLEIKGGASVEGFKGDGNINPYSLENCSEEMGRKSDNINSYSTSKGGQRLG